MSLRRKLSLDRESHPSSVSHTSEVIELSSERVEQVSLHTDSCFGGGASVFEPIANVVVYFHMVTGICR